MAKTSKASAPPASSTAAAAPAPSSFAVRPLLSDEGLDHRLSIGAASAGGTRGSLTRCAVRVSRSRAAANRQRQGADDGGAAADDTDEVVRELRFMQLEMTKMVLVVQRLEREIASSRRQIRQLEEEIERETGAVASLRQDQKQASSAQSCQQEYESLAKLISRRHPTPQSVLAESIESTKKELDAARTELRQREAETSVRKSQFQLLIQSMLDLKRSLTQETIQFEEGEVGGGGGDNDDDNDEQVEEDAVDKMDVDDENDGNAEVGEEEEGEEELYGDL